MDGEDFDDINFPNEDDFLAEDPSSSGGPAQIAPLAEAEQAEEQVQEDLICHEEQRSLFDDDNRLKIARDMSAMKIPEYAKLSRTFRVEDDRSHPTLLKNLFAFVACLAMDNLKKEDESNYFNLYPTIVTVWMMAAKYRRGKNLKRTAYS